MCVAVLAGGATYALVGVGVCVKRAPTKHRCGGRNPRMRKRPDLRTRVHFNSTPVRIVRRRYHGFFHGVRTIIAEQGIGGVYKGLTATILKQGAC